MEVLAVSNSSSSSSSNGNGSNTNRNDNNTNNKITAIILRDPQRHSGAEYCVHGHLGRIRRPWKEKWSFIRMYSKYITYYYVYVYVLMSIYRNEPATAEKNTDMGNYDTDSDTMC